MFSLPSLWVVSTGAPSQRTIKKKKKVWNIFFFCVFEWKIYIHVEIADVILTPVHQQILIIFSLSITIEAQKAKTWHLDSDSPKKHKQLIRKT